MQTSYAGADRKQGIALTPTPHSPEDALPLLGRPLMPHSDLLCVFMVVWIRVGEHPSPPSSLGLRVFGLPREVVTRVSTPSPEGFDTCDAFEPRVLALATKRGSAVF